MAEATFEGRELGLGLEKLGIGLGRVEFAGLAFFELDLSDAETFRLEKDILVSDGDLILHRADIDIGAGDIADEGDEGVVISGHGGEVGGFIGFDLAAEFSPEIDFPARGEEGLVGEKIWSDGEAGFFLAEILGEGVDEGIGGARAGGATVAGGNIGIGEAGGDALLLGEEVADAAVEFGAGLEDADSRGLEVEIIFVGEVNEASEGGIVKAPPPEDLWGTVSFSGDRFAFDPLGFDRGLGDRVIWTHHAGGRADERDRKGEAGEVLRNWHVDVEKRSGQKR